MRHFPPVSDSGFDSLRAVRVGRRTPVQEDLEAVVNGLLRHRLIVRHEDIGPGGVGLRRQKLVGIHTVSGPQKPQKRPPCLLGSDHQVLNGVRLNAAQLKLLNQSRRVDRLPGGGEDEGD